MINIDKYSDSGTHWIALYALNNNVTYFHSFRVEHIPKEIKKFIKNLRRSKIVANISKIQIYDSIMCGHFCIVFIDFMLTDKSLTNFTNLFLPINFR